MGRMRIKKKEAVIPFRETIAFRMILLTVSVIFFLVALYVLAGAFRTSLTLTIASGAAVVAAAILVFYNLDHMRDAKIPKHTMNRLKRR
jgi:uncharacterized membrane protein (GlpM family)